ERGAGEGVALRLKTREGSQRVHARFVVDATGPHARFARAMGAQPRVHDQLVWIGAVLNRPAEFSRLTMVESAESGWWYAAGVPGSRVVAAAITDAQTNRQAMLHRPQRWLSGLRKTRHMAGWLAECSFEDRQPMTIRATPSFVLDRVF